MLSAQQRVRDFCLDSDSVVGLNYDQLETLASSKQLNIGMLSETEAVVSDSSGGPEAPMCFIELSKGLVVKSEIKEF